jgi:tRNA (guanine-N7-)-methyltransferase
MNASDRPPYPPARNPYSAKILDPEFQTLKLALTDDGTEKYRGQWRAFFQEKGGASTSAPLHLEIGCNTGHVLRAWAEMRPDENFLGIEWKFKPVFQGAEKALKRGLKNLTFLRCHAGRLTRIFAPDELDSISIFFPDPWPKKSQQKNRIFRSADFLSALHLVLRPNGLLHFKTDHEAYFEEVLPLFLGAPSQWEVLGLTKNLHEGHPNPLLLKIPEITLFEGLFIKDQIPIKSLKLRKKASR